MNRPRSAVVDLDALVAAFDRAGVPIELVDGDGAVVAASASREGVEPIRIQCAEPEARLRAAEEELARVQPMAALGRLASNIAHEINNPTAHVLLNLSFAAERIEVLRKGGVGVNEVRELVQDGLAGVERIKRITRELRLFSEMERDEHGPVDLDETVRSVARLAGHKAHERARLRLFTGSVPPVNGDVSRLRMVVSNLLVNAYEAIDPGAGEANEISVTTRVDGDQVVLTVTDSGRGIPEELHARVFEPFFTTKQQPKATGMGLTVCAEIVRRHKGTIQLASAVGGGTRVEVRLPLYRPVTLAAGTGTHSRRRRVLVIDDDPMVLRAYTRVLSSAFDLVLAEGGAEALQIVARDQKFDAVLCDVMMPEIDGVTFLERASEVIPGIERRIVFCTGGGFSERTAELLAARELRTVEKPVDAATLRTLLEEVAAGADAGER